MTSPTSKMRLAGAISVTCAACGRSSPAWEFDVGTPSTWSAEASKAGWKIVDDGQFCPSCPLPSMPRTPPKRYAAPVSVNCLNCRLASPAWTYDSSTPDSWSEDARKAGWRITNTSEYFCPVCKQILIGPRGEASADVARDEVPVKTSQCVNCVPCPVCTDGENLDPAHACSTCGGLGEMEVSRPDNPVRCSNTRLDVGSALRPVSNDDVPRKEDTMKIIEEAPGPITPERVEELRREIIHPAVFQVVNKILVENYSTTKGACILESAIVAALDALGYSAIARSGLAFEAAYRAAGWNVVKHDPVAERTSCASGPYWLFYRKATP